MRAPTGAFHCRVCRRTFDGTELRRDPDVTGTRWVCGFCTVGVEKVSEHGKGAHAWRQVSQGLAAVAVSIALFLPVLFGNAVPLTVRISGAFVIGGTILSGLVTVQDLYHYLSRPPRERATTS